MSTQLAVTAADRLVNDTCGSQRGILCEGAVRLTHSQFIGRMLDIGVRPLRIVFIVLIALLLTSLLRRALRRWVSQVSGADTALRKIRKRAPLVDTSNATESRRTQRAETIAGLMRSTGTVVVWSFATTMILPELGLNIGGLIAGAGIAGIALGFGAQNLVRDFLTGIFMLVEDQYGVGDVIDSGFATGQVEGISLRTTRLRDVDGTVWHIPNGEIHRIGNKSQQWSRAVLDVDVAYATEIDHATQVIENTAILMWHDERFADVILEEPAVWGVETLSGGGISIRLVVKTQPMQQWKIARELRARIRHAFDAEGIEMSAPVVKVNESTD